MYLITCRRCGAQYIGKTTQHIHIRHGGHRSEVENESSELGEHFVACGGVENMEIQIIDCVKEGEEEALTVCEGYWQNKLATLTAHGGNINIRNEWNNFVGHQPIFF